MIKELVATGGQKDRSRLLALSTTGIIVGLCLGLTSCGSPPEEDTEQGEGQALMSCDQCNKDNCEERCDEGEGGVSQCKHKVPFCNGDDGFERPGDGRPGNPNPGTGGGGLPNCSTVRDRGCVGNGWVRTGQFVKRECWGWVVGCTNYIYDTYTQLRDSNQCEWCGCLTRHVKRCKTGLGTGWRNGSGDKCSINGPVRNPVCG